jgi:Icc protein
VLHITDPHLFAGWDECLRGINTREALQAVLDHVLATAWPADLVALTGDLIQDDSREAYGRVREMFSSLQLPTYCVPGNHDVRSLMREELQGPTFHYCAVSTQRNWAVIGVDSCMDGKALGCVDSQELQRLARYLDGAGTEHALVCLHHPPLKVGSAWLDTVGLENSQEFLQTIAASGKVRAVIFGHVHQAFDGEYSGIRIIGTPSTCRQFALNSDEFALDENPPAYRRLELNSDGSIDHELVWVPIKQ